MNDRRVPAPNKWPFYVADALLLGVAFWLLNHYPHPLPVWAAVLLTIAVILAAFLGVMPHRMEYSTQVKFAESDQLTSVATEMKKFQSAAEAIQSATSQWQGVQEHATRTVTSAREISDRIAAEAHSFTEFMQKANDSEKAALRLEVEKLRRGESQWLQILVHLLDHVFALHQAGSRSGQPNLQEQLGQFQDACRDIVRRVGLTPVEAAPDEPFDEERHQLLEGQSVSTSEPRVAHTLATGYTYQGQMLRRTLVALQANGSDETETASDAEPALETAGESEEAFESVGAEASAGSDDANPTEDPLLLSESESESAAGVNPVEGDSQEGFRLESEVLPHDQHGRKA